MSAICECAASSSKQPANAGPHPLKAMLHDLCRQIVRESSSITTNKLAELLANEDEVRFSCFNPSAWAAQQTLLLPALRPLAANCI